MQRTELSGIYNNIPQQWDEEGNLIPRENSLTEDDDFILDTIVPLSFSSTDDIGTLSILATSKSDKMFTICTNYKYENTDERLVANELPFSDESVFVSDKISSAVVVNHIPSFVTDFNFTCSKEPEDGFYFTLKARELTKEGTGDEVTFKITSDIYASLKFFDYYIFNHNINNHDLTAATISSYPRDEQSDVFFVDKVDRIIAMAPMEIEGEKRKKKDITNIAIEFVVGRMNIETKEYEKATILATFDIGQSFNIKKFKGVTIDNLNTNFYAEADQYLQMFNSFDKFTNIDKEYLYLKCTNKDKKSMIFFLDSTVRVELETMIGSF